MLQVSVGDYIIHMSESILEQNEYGFYAKHAKLVEEFGLERAEREAFSLTQCSGATSHGRFYASPSVTFPMRGQAPILAFCWRQRRTCSSSARASASWRTT